MMTKNSGMHPSSSGSARGARVWVGKVLAAYGHRRGRGVESPLILLQAVTAFADQGHQKQAERYFSRAASQVGGQTRRHQNSFAPSMLRRQGQILRTPVPAERAIRLVEDHLTPFRDMTARVLAGWTYLDRHNSRPNGRPLPIAQQRFEEILANDHCPWPYEAEARFGLGFLMLFGRKRSRALENAYKLLVQAQYI